MKSFHLTFTPSHIKEIHDPPNRDLQPQYDHYQIQTPLWANIIILAELLEEVEGYKPQYEELENLNKLIQNEVIFNNPYCKHTMESLNVSWEELHNC